MPRPHAHHLRTFRALAFLLTLALSFVIFPVPPAHAATEVVNSADDSFDGSCDATHCSLREAITAVGDTITFAPGITLITLTKSLPTIYRTLTIQGPGADKLTITGNNTFPLLAIASLVSDVTISGLTLTKGKAVAGYGGNLRAAAVRNLTLTGVALTAATADTNQGGAGVYIGSGTATLTGVTISGNTAPGSNTYGTGAGLYIDEYYGDTDVTITGSTIADNTAAAYGGGGVAVSRNYTPVIRLLIVRLNGTTVRDNHTSSGTGGSGGGIFNLHGTLTLTNSTLSGNTVDNSGGGIYSMGTLTLTNSTISGNSAANYGGGIVNEEGTLTLLSSTLIGNTASNQGGGLATLGGPTFPATTHLGKSIVAGNRIGATPQDCYTSSPAFAPLTSDGNNLVGNGTGCPSNGPGDLVLTADLATVLNPALADNGGPTRTHNLVPGGSAIDHIPGASCGVTNDQRGVSRPQNGLCDIGAVEYTATPPSPNPSPSPSPSSSPSTSPNPSPTPPPCGQRFGDVPGNDPACEAIEGLAARGVIKGCDQEAVPPLFCPTAPTLRAQMAALIVRAMVWGSETPNNPFTDQCDPTNPQNCIDGELWNAVGILGAKNVAKGYADAGTCAPAAAPCYAPRDNVLFAQTISFITRAMVQKGYWTQATTDDGTVYPNIPQASGHRLDFVTYTQNVGPVPGTSSATQNFAAWDQPSTRAWFAQALWQAFQTH